MTVRITQPPTTPFTALNAWLTSLYQELRRLDAENRKLQSDLEIAGAERLILHDPAGARYSIDVNATGPVVRATILP